MQIILGIIALSFLIIVHEFGHFIVAKLSDIKVKEFSLFMGPKLFSFQRGETAYSIRTIPLGGFVSMEGEEQESSDERAFNKKPILVRMAVIAAGAIMNLIAAIIIIAIVFSSRGYSTNKISSVTKDSPAYKAGIMENDKLIKFNGKSVFNSVDFSIFSYATKDKPVKIGLQRGNKRFTKTVIPLKHPAEARYLLGFQAKSISGPDSNVVDKVSAGSAAEKVGLKSNDRITGLNDVAIKNKTDISNFLAVNKGNMVKVTVLRGGKPLVLGSASPTEQKTPEYYETGINGFANAKSGIAETIKQSFIFTYSTARSVFYSLAYLVSRKISPREMMGPVGIVNTIGDVVQQSPSFSDKLIGLLFITAFLSVNLGVFNLFPFPALDGSKIVLLAIEAIRRKALPPEREAFINMVGFVLLIMLMIFATSNDIIRLFS